MKNLLNLSGKLVVSPKRPDFKKQHKKDVALIEIHNIGVSKYLISQLEVIYGPWMNLSSPMYGIHLTLVGGYGRVNHDILKPYINKFFSFYVDLASVKRTPWSDSTSWGFWFVDVLNFEHIEKTLSLKIKSPHVTIARENHQFNLCLNMKNICDQEYSLFVNSLLDIITPETNYQLMIELIRRKTLKFSSIYDIIYLLYESIAYPSKPWEFKVIKFLKSYDETN